MKTRPRGWTGLELTTIGLGTRAIGGGGWSFAWGPQDDAESIGAIHRALELGINWIDTAPAYGLGHAEEVVERALAGVRPRPLIATKCGRSWNDQRELVPNLTAEVIRAEVDASLRRLRVDVIDLHQIHWPESDEQIEEAWGVIAGCVRQGKIRHAGVSNFNIAQITRLQSIHPVASVQPPYSLVARVAEDELLSYCAAHKLGVLAYSPMHKGLLTGKFSRERIEQLPTDDHRRRDPQFQEPNLSANLRLVERLQEVAHNYGRTPAQVAIAWVLRRPEVTAAIVGGRRPAQVEEIVGAADWLLPQADVEMLSALVCSLGRSRKSLEVPCR